MLFHKQMPLWIPGATSGTFATAITLVQPELGSLLPTVGNDLHVAFLLFHKCK